MSPYLCAGSGADPSRPPCRKAKDLRKERRLQKEQTRQHGVSLTKPAPSLAIQPKSLEDLVSELLPDDATHRLEVSWKEEAPFLSPLTFPLGST